MRAALAIVMWCALAATTHAAEFRASVDRHALASDEHLLFTLTLSNSDTRLRAVGVDPNVDLSMLTNQFDVGTPRDSNRYNIYRGRGRSTSEITVELFPKRAGTLTIPPFAIDGLKTAPIAINVSAATSAEAPLVFARQGVSNTKPWQFGAVNIWLDVYHRAELKEAKLGSDLELEPTALDTLEHQRLAVATRQDTVNGYAYDVMRTTWTLYPTQPGALKGYVPEVWITMATGEQRRLPRSQVDMEVTALPSGVAADVLIGAPQLDIALVKDSEQAGAPATLRATLRTTSRRLAIPAELMLRADTGLQIYSGAPRIETTETSDGVQHVATYTYSIVAATTGVWAGPEFGVRYFDPQRAVMDVVTATAPTLHITQTATVAPSAATLATATLPNANSPLPANPWRTATVFMAVAWFITALWLLRRNKTPRAASVSMSVPPRRGSPTRPLEATLLHALNADSLEEGLTRYEHAFGTDEELRAAVRAVQALYYDRHNNATPSPVNAERINALAKNITARALSTPSTDAWSPERFLSRRS